MNSPPGQQPDAPGAAFKKTARAAAAALLSRLNVADREEFDFYREMLAQTAARLRELEERIAWLEKTQKNAAEKPKTARKTARTKP